MSRTPAPSSFFGIGSWPHSGMPGAPCGRHFAARYAVGVDRKQGIVDARRHVVVVAEHYRAAGVFQQPRLHRRRLITAVGCQVPRSTQSVALDQRLLRLRMTSSLKTAAPAMFSPRLRPLMVAQRPRAGRSVAPAARAATG